MKGMGGCRVDQSPLPFSFAISTDAKRIEAEFSVLSGNVAEHHAFLCSRAFR